jgi:hypothetical protein
LPQPLPSGANKLVAAGGVLSAELLPKQRDYIVGLGIAAEHRFLEDGSPSRHVEDPVRPCHDLDDADLCSHFEQPRRRPAAFGSALKGRYSMRIWWRSVTSASSQARIVA